MGRRRLLIGAFAAVFLVALVSMAWAAVPRHSPVSLPPLVPRASLAPPAIRPETAPAWSTAWSTALGAAEPVTGRASGWTYRDVVHLTAGGNAVRIRLANRFGKTKINFKHVTIAYALSSAPLLSGGSGGSGVVSPSSNAAAARGTMHTVTFAGSPELEVAPGASVVSDPIPLRVLRGADLLVSMWVPAGGGAPSIHGNARQTSFLAPGSDDHAGDLAAGAYTKRTTAWFHLTAVEVRGGPGTVVALGDSITDGVESTSGHNRRWTDYLADRLAATGQPGYGVANSGISGNRLRLDAAQYNAAGPSALHRLDSDVIGRAGVRSVVVLEGINDLLLTPRATDPADVIDPLAQIANACHAAGLRVIGGTLLPAQGWHAWDPDVEVIRQQVNAWIRTGGAFDAVADFDAAVRDPADPTRMLPVFDSGDHLHPNDAGDAALASAVPLAAL